MLAGIHRFDELLESIKSDWQVTNWNWQAQHNLMASSQTSVVSTESSAVTYPSSTLKAT